MVDSWHHRNLFALLAGIALMLAACASPSPTPSPVTAPAVSPSRSIARATLTPAVVESGAAATDSAAPTASTGFMFAADDVVAYYESQGFACTKGDPSTTAAGYAFRTCSKSDAGGLTLTIGVVTDPSGDLGDGFASVQGKDGEAVLAPTDALDHLAGFLGAMLGEEQGSSLLEWLAGHLGDIYAETTAGPLKVATYTESKSDLSKLYVELANDAYLGAPTP